MLVARFVQLLALCVHSFFPSTNLNQTQSIENRSQRCGTWDSQWFIRYRQSFFHRGSYRITPLAKKDVQDNNQSAENKKDRHQKPLPHSVLHLASIHDVLAVRSISLTTYACASVENKQKVRGDVGIRSVSGYRVKQGAPG
jgi:hypothetical protein